MVQIISDKQYPWINWLIDTAEMLAELDDELISIECVAILNNASSPYSLSSYQSNPYIKGFASSALQLFAMQDMMEGEDDEQE